MSLYWRIINVVAKYYSRLKGKLTGHRGGVLVFHEVVGAEDKSCRISPKTFIKILERLGKDFCFVSVSDILDNVNPNRIAITFDDVPHSFLDNAYPLLKEKDIPFTLFVCKKFVGREGFLSEKEIVALDKDPLCTIGAHTCNHIKLRYEKDSANEIKESKDYLEKLLGHSILYMAYPYGRHDSVSKRNRKEVRTAGFEAAFSTINSPVPTCYKKYFIPRIEQIK